MPRSPAQDAGVLCRPWSQSPMPTVAHAGWVRSWPRWRTNRNFRRLWLAQVISETGDWFYMVSLYGMLLEFTGRAELLGVAFVLQVFPQALTGTMAGVVNDRISRKRVLIASDLA